jgi:WD40 repeat protein
LLSFQAADVKSVALSPDSKRIMVGGNTLSIWDIGSGKKLIEVRESVIAADFNPNGALIAFLPAVQSVLPEAADAKIMDVAAGRVRRVVQGRDGRIVDVAFNRDGTRLITAGRDYIQHWDATADDRLAGMSYGPSPSGSSVSPNATRRTRLPGFGVPALEGPREEAAEPIRVWGQGDQPIFTSPPVGAGKTRDLTFSADDRLLLFWRLATLQEGSHTREQTELRVWDIEAASEVLKVVDDDRIRGTAFSRDGRRLAALLVGAKVSVRAWDTDTGRQLFARPLGIGTNAQLAISPDGARLAVLWLDGERSLALTVMDAGNGQEIVSATQSLPPDWTWYGWLVQLPLALSPQGARVAFPLSSAEGVASQTVAVRVWDAASGKPPVDLKGIKGRVSALAFSPDGQRLATLSGGNILNLWDPSTGAELLRLNLPSKQAHHVSFAPDGRSVHLGLLNTDTAEYEARVLDATPR